MAIINSREVCTLATRLRRDTEYLSVEEKTILN
jgi:hypothetical protein